MPIQAASERVRRMREIHWGNASLLVVFLTFVAFPVAAASQAVLMSQSGLPDQVRLLIGGVCVLLTIPLLAIVLFGLRHYQE